MHGVANDKYVAHGQTCRSHVEDSCETSSSLWDFAAGFGCQLHFLLHQATCAGGNKVGAVPEPIPSSQGARFSPAMVCSVSPPSDANTEATVVSEVRNGTSYPKLGGLDGRTPKPPKTSSGARTHMHTLKSLYWRLELALVGTRINLSRGCSAAFSLVGSQEFTIERRRKLVQSPTCSICSP